MYEAAEAKLDCHYGTSKWREKIVQYMFGDHFVNGRFAEIDLGNGCFLDPYGSEKRRGSILHFEKYPIQSATINGYNWPDPECLADWVYLRDIYKNAAGSFRVCGIGGGFFERSWALRGMENLLIDMIETPDFVEELMDGYLELSKRVIKLISDRIPCEAIIGGGDDCDQRGPIMGLERWRKFVKPRLAKIIDYTHSLGKPYIAHMCGNVMPLVDDLMDIGLDALESIQPEAMDVYALKRKTEKRLILIGGLGVQHILPRGSVEEVKAEATRLIRELGYGGGYVLSSSKPIAEDVPVGNIIAFLEAATGQRIHGH